MSGDRAFRRKKLRRELAELKERAIADLERRGYAVRGKTPAQIKQMLKRRPAKRGGYPLGDDTLTTGGRVEPGRVAVGDDADSL
jgi:hypothetical protein